MKLLRLIYLCLPLIACAPSAPTSSLSQDNATGVIYHGDSREEVAASDPHAELAKATAILIEDHRLSLKDPANIWTVKASQLKQNYPLCSDEAFIEQTTLGFCSGVLIAPNKVLTAGHCFSQKVDCLKTKIAFGWTSEKALTPQLPKSDVYSCKNILAHKNSRSSGLDYAIIELDRDVTGATPVRIAQEKSRKKGDLLLSLSHPLGLPMKKDQARVLNDNEQSNLLKVEVDTFMGSSGSPLFDDQGALVGILSMGMEDILEDDIYRVQTEGGCVNFNRCKDGVCFGESFLKATRIDL